MAASANLGEGFMRKVIFIGLSATYDGTEMTFRMTDGLGSTANLCDDAGGVIDPTPTTFSTLSTYLRTSSYSTAGATPSRSIASSESLMVFVALISSTVGSTKSIGTGESPREHYSRMQAGGDGAGFGEGQVSIERSVGWVGYVLAVWIFVYAFSSPRRRSARCSAGCIFMS